MQPAKPATFGKRGDMARGRVAPAVARSASAVAPVLAATESGIPIEELARRLGGGAGVDSGRDLRVDEEFGPRVVPWSGRAALVAGIGAACLSAGATVLSGPPTLELVPGVTLSPQGSSGMMGTALMGWSLFSGGKDAAGAMILAHGGLRFLNIKSPIAYAIGGAVVSLGSTLVNHALFGGWESMGTDALVGALAGGLYRIIAGTQPAKKSD